MSKDKLPPEDLDESPEWTEDMMKRSRPGAEVLTGLIGADAAARVLNKGGRPKAETVKVPVTMRLDPDVVAAYRASGPRWQSRVNEVLRQHMPKKEAQS
ncbi:MAG: hypothetical protein JWO51_167 [Rhodospirillales bacterium]|nr:hypothetical protein [Rhodospirillales bacterium]